jgi:hypothetical protein
MEPRLGALSMVWLRLGLIFSLPAASFSSALSPEEESEVEDVDAGSALVPAAPLLSGGTKVSAYSISE